MVHGGGLKKGGRLISRHRKEAELHCKKGWTGRNCDACAAGWIGDNCDECTPGWLPPDCITCRFGFSAESNCTGCIQNGLWTGTVHDKDLTVRLMFTGETCSTVAPGKFTNATHTMCLLLNVLSELIILEFM